MRQQFLTVTELNIFSKSSQTRPLVLPPGEHLKVSVNALSPNDKEMWIIHNSQKKPDSASLPKFNHSFLGYAQPLQKFQQNPVIDF